MVVYNVEGTALQNASNVITWGAVCRTDGEIDTTATTCAVTLYELGDGTETAVDGATGSDANPSARGVFCGQMTVDLDAGVLHYLYVTMTVGGGTREGWIPLGIPVRAG